MTETTSGIATLGIDWKIFIAQLINFLVVMLVLWKFAYKPIVKMLDQRSEKIEKGMKDAKDVEERLAKLEEERADVIKLAKAEAKKIADEARADAEERKAEMVEKAKREVERVVVNGKAQLKTEKETMMREARKEIVEIAVTASRKILEKAIDEKKAQSLAEEVVRKMT
jgi:F-type H+-transporting ATPase subunit b